jgi:D-beta-D-heptose 7-phosphate kinase/D-beta-D-heptose 1-phosphate adenosyltransferase
LLTDASEYTNAKRVKIMIQLPLLHSLIDQFSRMRILVVGDVMLDEYLWGKVSRISPEAPVPVLDVMSEAVKLGGAANVLHNLKTLGATPLVASLIGDDANGRKLVQQLQKLGISDKGLFVDPSRPTTIKTRIISEYHRHHQQLARLDRECRDDMPSELESRVIDYVRHILPSVDGVIIEDYGKGVVTANLVHQIVALATDSKKIVAVDPKTDHFPRYSGVTVITPNHYEAGAAVQMSIESHERLLQAGTQLLHTLTCDFALITRGEDGMSLFDRQAQTVTHVPAVAKEVYDVAGAGDTVIAAFTLALSGQSAPADAVILSNAAAGVVVGKMGIATVSPQELQQALAELESGDLMIQQESL